jgi:hypothetical protein
MIVGTVGADVGDRRDASDREGVERLTFGATDLLLDFNVVAGYLTDSRSLTIVAFPNDHAKHVEAVAEDDIIRSSLIGP